MIRNNVRNTFITIILSLFFLGQFYINVGFALKPYMLGALIILLILVAYKRTLYHFNTIDKILLLFICFMFLGLLFSRDISSSLRYIFGTLLVGFSALQYRTYLQYFCSKEQLENAIHVIGIIFGVVSIVYYAFGLIHFNFNFYGNDISAYGVLIDRSVPRLITLASDDPNISFLFLSFFLCYYLCNLKSVVKFFGLALYLLLCFLTMSRAAYISMAIMLILFVLHNNSEKHTSKIMKMIIFVMIVFAILLTVSAIFEISLLEIMKSRFSLSSSGMHSGRINLWKNALITFYNNPIFGIGINSSLSYNLQHYGTVYYVHNTYLEVLSETGLIGLVLYLLLIFTIISHNKKNISVSLFPYCFTVSLLVQNFFLSTLISEMFFLLLVITSFYDNIRATT